MCTFVLTYFLVPFIGRFLNVVLYMLLTRFLACCATPAGMIHMSPTTQGLHWTTVIFTDPAMITVKLNTRPTMLMKATMTALMGTAGTSTTTEHVTTLATGVRIGPETDEITDPWHLHILGAWADNGMTRQHQWEDGAMAPIGPHLFSPTNYSLNTTCFRECEVSLATCALEEAAWNNEWGETGKCGTRILK